MEKSDWWQRSLNRPFRLLKRKSRTLEQRQRIEEKSIQLQKKPTLEQQEKTFGRAHRVMKIVETIASMDMLERRKISKELTWRAKWNARRTKFSARTRKHNHPFQETRTALQLKGREK